MASIYYTDNKPNLAIMVNGKKVRFEDIHSKSDFLQLLTEGMIGKRFPKSTIIEREVKAITVAENQDGEIVYLKIDP